ncbi:MAG: protein kinase [Deltaproteobacteria bacterium]|nr:protein kinase [Deltaproteobacteria bacterium]
MSTDPFGLVGQVLDGQFRVDQLVGEGGFSIVYRGHHLGLNEPIAIKCLKLPAALGTSLVDTFVQRFRDESRILYRLSQGNLHVVRSIAAGTTQAPATGALVPYMVLEWLDGRSLQTDFELRKGQKGRPLAEVMRMFETAADGLAHAHAQGVIHRDLNPGNLFIAKTAAGEKMKVLDFGVAKIMHDSTLDIGPRAQTIGAIRIFAPAYGAPEQFDDRIGQVGAWSDVYAFALVILQALQDKCVMEGEHLGDFAQGAVDPQKRPTPRALGIDVPEEVERVFARATALYPKNRWQSAGDFWRSLVTASGATTSASASPPKGDAPAPTPVARGPLAKTMPLGSAGVGSALRAGAPRPRMPTTIGIPAPAGTSPGSAPAVPAAPAAPAAAPTASAPTAVAPAAAAPAAPSPAIPRPLGAPPSVPRPPMPSSPGGSLRSTTARPPSMPKLPAQAAAPAAPVTPPVPPVRPPMDSEPPTGIAPPPLSAQRGSANMRTATGLAPSPWDPKEGEEEESTKVGAPTDEVLRAIADSEDAVEAAPARMSGTAAMPPLPRTPHASPVLENSDELASLASAALHAGAGAPPPIAPEPKRESSIPPPPDSGGTLMMVAPGAEAQHQQRLEYEARIAEEQAEKAAAARPAKQKTVAFGQAPAFPQAPPPFQAQPPAPPTPAPLIPPPQIPAPPLRPEVSQMHAPANLGLGSTVAMAPPISPGATSQIVGMHPSPRVPPPADPHAPPPAVSLPAAPLGAPPPPPAASPQGAPFPAHFNSPGARPSMVDGGALPQSFAQPQVGPQPTEGGQKKLPVIPIAAGGGLLAVIGIVLVVLALKATKQPNPDGTSSASADTASATPVPVPVPVATDTTATSATAAPPPVATVIEADDAGPAPTEDASTAPDAATAASASASAVASAPTTPPAAPTAPTTPPATGAAPPPTVATATPPPNPFAPPPAPSPSAKPAADPNAFNEGAARSKLSQANGVLAFCKKEGGVTGPGNASVTFSIDGSVAGVALDPPYGGTGEGSCVAAQFRRVKVNPFTGAPQTIRHSFEVPK